jgi:precorrin-6A/cobalt-precorrin-6A reductase
MDTFSENAAARKTILLLSGTCEGPHLAQALTGAGFRVRATVTRQEARDHLFAAVRENTTVEARGFTEESLSTYLSNKHADLVLDATHPFAVRITRIAHAVCARFSVPYVRYERPDWPPPLGTYLVDSFAEAAARLPELGRRVMLTIGAKQLKHFAQLHDRLTMIARILPSVVSLEQAAREGFTAGKVLCMRPPFSTAFNKSLFREYQIEVLVTKASGHEGGVVEKVTAARELGIHVVMIRRPAMPDIDSVSTFDGAVAQCLRHLNAP